jgi:hypothetical protein
MSVILGNTVINYGETTTITIDTLQNITITPENLIINTEITLNGIIATVQPLVSTIFYIKGYNNLGNLLTFNETVYVNVIVDQPTINILYGESVTITANGSSTYKWYPNSIFSTNQSITVTPKENTLYTVIGTDPFNTISYAYVTVSLNSNLTFTPYNPTLFSGNLLELSVNYTGLLSSQINIQNLYDGILLGNELNSELQYTWKSNLFKNLPNNCSTILHGNSIRIHPYNSIEYEVNAYIDNTLITKGNIKINVIPKPPNIVDYDIIPLSLFNLVIERDSKQLSKELLKNPVLSRKIIKFYYTTLQTAYRMEFTNKSGISIKVPWFTYYQQVNEANEMIISFKQQWELFKFINNNQTRRYVTSSNFAFLLNNVNRIYLEHPQKIYITPI